MTTVKSIRDINLAAQQLVRPPAEANAPTPAQITATSMRPNFRRSLADGRNPLLPNEMKHLDRLKGLGNLLDTRR